MIWPFKRKPAPKNPYESLDPGPINEDWHPGDLAECIMDGWWFPTSTGPEFGDVNVVQCVSPGVAIDGKPRWFLAFLPYPREHFDAAEFRKLRPLNSAADAEFTAQIKRGRKVDA